MKQIQSGSTPLLSIVTPVFNGAKFIERCIRSIADQRVDRVEHIVMDGGSTDGTVELLQSLSASHPHLIVQSEPDRGQSHALNKGISLAQADLMGILNVDDFYQPGVLRRAIDLLSGLEEPSFVVGDCNLWKESGELWFVNRPRFLRPWQLMLGTELVQFPLNPSAYFYHRSIHEMVGLYSEDRHYAMDLDFILAASNVVRFHHIDQTWGNFCLSSSCKTVAGGSGDASIMERESVYRKHRASLPWMQRWLVSGAAAISNSKIGETTRFVWRRPDLAVRRLGHRLFGKFGGQ